MTHTNVILSPEAAGGQGRLDTRPADRPFQREVPRRGALIGPSFASALEALWVNRLRSLLTLLGVIVGVGAVIGAVSITQGTSAQINANYAGIGTNVLTIFAGSVAGGTVSGASSSQQAYLTTADADALAGLAHVAAVSPVSMVAGTVAHGGKSAQDQVQGVYPAYQSIENWQIAGGAWWTASDESSGAAVAVIGKKVADDLFGTGSNPVGQTIFIKSQAFRVVGVLKSKGAQGGLNQDNVIFIPFSIAAHRFNHALPVSQIEVEVDSTDQIAAVKQAVTALLQARHGGSASFNILSANDLVASAQQSAQTLTYLLVGIAAISLIVGGIGILNIMLVSATERTREIGIRMAVGARRGDIRNQFLIEALTLSSAGGGIGAALGLIAGLALTRSMQLPFVPAFGPILLALGVAAAIGLTFGLYPALRASRLDPIVALRAE
jgi:putative ABC transport system permease protein